jgi:hypothetical protein
MFGIKLARPRVGKGDHVLDPSGLGHVLWAGVVLMVLVLRKWPPEHQYRIF